MLRINNLPILVSVCALMLSGFPAAFYLTVVGLYVRFAIMAMESTNRDYEWPTLRPLIFRVIRAIQTRSTC